jgi:hypothetical protein
MLTPNYDIISNEQLLETPSLQQLLTVVAPRFITYIVFNAEEKKVALLKQYQLDFFPDKTIEENLKDILETDSNLKQTFQKSFVIYDYPSSGLIPEELFNTSLNKPATELLYGDVEKGLLLSEKVMKGKMYNVYRIPREIHTLLQQQFGSGKYWHLHTLLLENRNVAATLPCQIELTLKDDSMMVGVWNNEVLQLLQQYPIETLEDMIYYLQLIVKQLDLHPGNIDLRWCGKNKFVEDVAPNLQKYFANVQPAALIGGWSLGDAFSNTSVHFYTNYLNLVACV